jgi:hypothetical protein
MVALGRGIDANVVMFEASGTGAAPGSGVTFSRTLLVHWTLMISPAPRSINRSTVSDSNGRRRTRSLAVRKTDYRIEVMCS